MNTAQPEIDVRDTLDADVGVQEAPSRAQRGRPRKTNPREPLRDPVRGAVVVTGRNGEQLSRRRKDDGKDIFEIPADLKEPGWSYQWCAVSITGNTDMVLDQNLMLQENGWRPVKADRWPGRFMPVGHTGAIIRGGQMLMERPARLTEEAEQENYAKAYQQMRDRDESLMGRKANLGSSIPDGFNLRRDTNYKGRRTQMGIDHAYDIPAPRHELAEPGE